MAYEGYADLLYDLARQVTRHLLSRHSREDAGKILRMHEKEILERVHKQLQRHVWSKTSTEVQVTVVRGFTLLKSTAYTAQAGVPPHDFRTPPSDRLRISQYVFSGFSRCLYAIQKFDADAERKLGVILDRDALKWFRPARGQFAIVYRTGGEEGTYQPDFVAETAGAILILECKHARELEEPEVVAKRDAAVTWCGQATRYTAAHGGKPWLYVLVPHDVVAQNRSLQSFAETYTVADPSLPGTAAMPQA